MKIYLLAALLLVGCERTYETTRRVNSCETPAERAALATFIVECAKAANPMSDEEGEDLVEECRRSGIFALCPEVSRCYTVVSDSLGGSYSEVEKPCPK